MPNSDESKITRFVSGLRRGIRDVVEVRLFFYKEVASLSHQGGITNF